MTEFSGADEVRDRLNLIESMMLEGRRSTEHWGWVFVLWGVAYYVAIVWSVEARFGWAWPITVIAAVLISELVRRARGGAHARTALSRSVGAVWSSFGVSIFLLLMGLALSGRLTDGHVAFAIIAAMLGMVNGASGMILRWKPQMACAVVWWAAALVCCWEKVLLFETPLAFLAAVFLCQIVFGVYLMYLESRKSRAQGEGIASHA